MPTTTIFLSYLTNTAPRRDRGGCPQGVPTRHGPESPAAGTLAGSRGEVHSRPTRREGETWSSGLAPPRAGSVKDGGATAARGPAVIAPGARAPPPGSPVSAPGPKWSRGCVQVGRVLCRKSGNGERGPKPPAKGGNRKRRSYRGGEGDPTAGPPRGRTEPAAPLALPSPRPGMNEAPPPATGAHSQAT